MTGKKDAQQGCYGLTIYNNRLHHPDYVNCYFFENFQQKDTPKFVRAGSKDNSTDNLRNDPRLSQDNEKKEMIKLVGKVIQTCRCACSKIMTGKCLKIHQGCKKCLKDTWPRESIGQFYLRSESVTWIPTTGCKPKTVGISMTLAEEPSESMIEENKKLEKKLKGQPISWSISNDKTKTKKNKNKKWVDMNTDLKLILKKRNWKQYEI